MNLFFPWEIVIGIFFSKRNFLKKHSFGSQPVRYCLLMRKCVYFLLFDVEKYGAHVHGDVVTMASILGALGRYGVSFAHFV